MNCPHTWFSTELKGGKRLLRTRLHDLLRPAPKRGRALAVLMAALALCAGALVACRTAPAEESTAPVLVEDEISETVLRLAPAALGLEEGSLTLSEPFSVELNGTEYWYYDLFQGEETVGEVSADLSTGTVQLRPTASVLTISLVEPHLPQGALAFRDALPALVERYGALDSTGDITLFYLGDYLTEAFPPVWGFRAAQRTGNGWTVLDDWYQEQESHQVYSVSFSLDGLLSYIPGTFRFPETVSDPATSFYPELDQYALAQAGGWDYAYGEMTLAAAHYYDPEDPASHGFDGIAAYHCPITLSGQPGWTDPAPYSVYLHTTDRYVYLGRYNADEAGSEEALAALAEDYFQLMDTPTWDRYLPTLTDGNYFDPEAGVFTSDALHFSWQLPGTDGYYTNRLIFRPVEGGLAVYHRYAYERYVSEHGGVEPEGIEPGSGCLVQILAGPEDPLPTLPEGREVNLLGRSAVPGVPGGNGWYYLPVTDFTWHPSSEFWDDYSDTLAWLTSKAVFTLY